MAEDKIRLESDAIEKIEDPVLEQLEEEEAKRAALTGHMRKGPEDLPDEEDESCEYDLEVMKPRAVDIRDLFKRTEQKIPDAWEAALGPRRPLMVFHGITPFHRRGTKPTPIWGMGYEVRLVDTDGNTIAIEPGSEVETIGKIDTSVNLGLKGGLTLEMPDKGIELSREIPGVSMTGASVHTTTDNQFSFALRLELSQLKVLAGPVGAGGRDGTSTAPGSASTGSSPWCRPSSCRKTRQA